MKILRTRQYIKGNPFKEREERKGIDHLREKQKQTKKKGYTYANYLLETRQKHLQYF